MARRIITIAAALVLALLGTLLVVTYVGRADARALQGIETVEVLVATGPLSKGQTVAEAQAAGLIESQPLPRRVVPPQSLTELSPEDAELVFASEVTPGEILQRPRLVAAPTPSGELVIPDGKLAVTVQLADPARVGGFVRVGSEIAIFDSYNVFEGNEGESWTPSGDRLNEEFEYNKATRVLLPRVTVLAIGEQTVPAAEQQRSEEETEEAPADPASEELRMSMVTVAVDQRQAEKLIHGTQTGTLYLGLLGAYEVQPGPGVDNRSLFDE